MDFSRAHREITRGKAIGRPVADESVQIEVSDQNYGYVAPMNPVSLLSTTTDLRTQTRTIVRELPRVHAELSAASTANDVCWRQHGWHALKPSGNWFDERSTSV